ncbi:PREDICTED: uncharacterized protein LOC109340114 [Lupinus angustifolius]|uniref:uncharacterized protein LOC109340114 n=1 Tax=Lupinus angustifolius TaxID=3871 RepID=UPI00092F6B43|nr:PREDICTED: uncharacterized protein LOC109340114 [Lupinus angustifolius]
MKAQNRVINVAQADKRDLEAKCEQLQSALYESQQNENGAWARYHLNIAPKHPYHTRLQSKLMADQESSSIGNRSELAEMKEQINQMMKIIQDMQKARSSEEDTTASGAKPSQSTEKVGPKTVTGANRRKGVIISLTGAAMGWYIRLEKVQIKTFIDVSNAFMKQYKYNEDAAPDRAQLQSMAKKPEESFKEYTQRWRALASQEPYYDYFVGSVASSFNALIKVGEKIEGRIRSGKLVVDQPKSGIGKKPNFMKKKEGEALAMFTKPKGYKAQNPKYQASNIATPSTQPNYTAHNNNRQNQNQTQAYQNQTQNRNLERRGPQFDPIPIPYAELYSHLLRERVISPIIGMIPESPGAWFNPNVTCEYHSWVIGHSIEHCRALKHKVQSLVNAKQLHFKPIVPNVDRNPLPNHGNQGVNAIEEAQGSTFIWEADEVKTPMRLHPQITRWVPVISKMEPILRPAAEERPQPFPYKTDKAVPWIYSGGNSETTEQQIEVTNVVGDNEITRSGRVYVPSDAEKALSKDKGKGKVCIHVEDELEANLNDLLHNHRDKGEVSNEEACEFLKFIKQSEYRVVDQLNRIPNRISILSLLMSSEPHRKVLVEILNRAYVSHDITTVKLGDIINNIMADNYISFSDQEIPSEGMGHTSPLHISIIYHNCLIGKVLIDNGSSLNVMSKRTLSSLVDASYMRPNFMVVKLQLFVGKAMDPCFRGCTFLPSTLHQRVKFIVDGKLLTIMGEEDMLVSKSLDTPYIEAVEEAIGTSFPALEIANASFVGGGTPTLRPQPSEASLMMARVMLQKGYQPRKGLGKFGQGRESLVMLWPNKGRYDLGYRPTQADRERTAEEKMKEKMVRLGQWEYEAGNISIPHISWNFVCIGLEPRMIAVVGDDD